VTVSALILAGGKATRFGGIAKHELVVEGETIFTRQVRVLAPRVAEILISGPEIAGYRHVRDVHEGAGPLAGISAGLAACTTSWLLVMAGDMPHVTSALIDAMIASSTFELAEVSSASPRVDLDAVGVRSGGLPEPLLSLLHVRTQPVIERALAAGRYKASRLLTDEGLRVRWLDADPDAVRNINSPEDLARTPGSK
jgi:molybdopterin-guanine dinucleotide biosynthesis protein A